MAIRKCVVCDKPILPDQESVPYKNRHAHVDCFNLAIKITTTEKKKTAVDNLKKTKKSSTTSKPKSELKNAMSEDEFAEKQNYYNTLKRLMNTDKLSAKIYHLSETYLKKYEDFTFQGMANSLVYYFEIMENPIEGDCVGIIPYCYSEAKTFFNGVKRSESLNKDFTENEIKELYKARVVKINPKKTPTNLINIEKIGDDD